MSPKNLQHNSSTCYMEQKEMLNLYNKAKDAYYNGVEIMDDYEFDELEESLGLSNKGYVGSVSSSYTIPHPIIMGTLSKVQIKNIDGKIDWEKYYEAALTYVVKANDKKGLIITPKFDGCSFETVIENGKIISISTRGSKDYGKDVSPFLSKLINRNIDLTSNQLQNSKYCIRGEILVDKNTYIKKYQATFTNPRSFVSGLIGQKYDENNNEQKEQIEDLRIVIYDVKVLEEVWTDLTWLDCDFISPNVKPQTYTVIENFDINIFIDLYDTYSKYRSECNYALDGYVIKPLYDKRPTTFDERPKDTVAIKFMPFLKSTIVRGIEWSIGKSGELFPTLIFDAVELDNREITRASASNFGKLQEYKINIGAEIVISLAGDIIPYIFKVVKASDNTDYFATVPFNREDLIIDGCHLYKKMDETEILKMDFIASCKILEIKGIGDIVAEKLFNAHNCKHILCYPIEEIGKVYDKKTKDNLIASIQFIKTKLDLAKLICSCNFQNCGIKTSIQCANFIANGNADFKGLDSKSYEWVFNKDSNEYKFLNYIVVTILNTTFNALYSEANVDYDKIPIIMTGSPSLYKTKKEFLENNSQFRETTSWQECKVLFTNDVNSTSSKMHKAKRMGIKIEIY